MRPRRVGWEPCSGPTYARWCTTRIIREARIASELTPYDGHPISTEAGVRIRSFQDSMAGMRPTTRQSKP